MDREEQIKSFIQKAKEAGATKEQTFAAIKRKYPDYFESENQQTKEENLVNNQPQEIKSLADKIIAGKMDDPEVISAQERVQKEQQAMEDYYSDKKTTQGIGRAISTATQLIPGYGYVAGKAIEGGLDKLAEQNYSDYQKQGLDLSEIAKGTIAGGIEGTAQKIAWGNEALNKLSFIPRIAARTAITATGKTASKAIKGDDLNYKKILTDSGIEVGTGEAINYAGKAIKYTVKKLGEAKNFIKSFYDSKRNISNLIGEDNLNNVTIKIQKGEITPDEGISELLANMSETNLKKFEDINEVREELRKGLQPKLENLYKSSKDLRDNVLNKQAQKISDDVLAQKGFKLADDNYVTLNKNSLDEMYGFKDGSISPEALDVYSKAEGSIISKIRGTTGKDLKVGKFSPYEDELKLNNESYKNLLKNSINSKDFNELEKYVTEDTFSARDVLKPLWDKARDPRLTGEEKNILMSELNAIKNKTQAGKQFLANYNKKYLKKLNDEGIISPEDIFNLKRLGESVPKNEQVNVVGAGKLKNNINNFIRNNFPEEAKILDLTTGRDLAQQGRNSVLNILKGENNITELKNNLMENGVINTDKLIGAKEGALEGYQALLKQFRPSDSIVTNYVKTINDVPELNGVLNPLIENKTFQLNSKAERVLSHILKMGKENITGKEDTNLKQAAGSVLLGIAGGRPVQTSSATLKFIDRWRFGNKNFQEKLLDFVNNPSAKKFLNLNNGITDPLEKQKWNKIIKELYNVAKMKTIETSTQGER